MKKLIKNISDFFVDLWGWIRSVWIITFRPISKPAILYGFGAYKFGCRYAIKRDDNWPPRYDQMGKQQGIFPVGDIKLIVCSRLELKHFQKLKMIDRNVNVRKMMKRASYYKTQMNYKLKNN